MCIDCYERLQAIQAQQVYMYQYMAWKAEEDMNDHFEAMGAPVRRRPPPPRPNSPRSSIAVNNVSVTGSQIGSLNTGAIGTFAASINQLKQGGQSELAERLNQLTSEVLKSAELVDKIKNELVEQLGSIAEEVAKQPQARRASTVKALGRRITEILGQVPALNKLWDHVQELLSILFP
jgi:hypothetical protein